MALKWALINTILVTLSLATSTTAAELPAGVKTIDLLPPGPDNPRNSEGDFVTLEDGRILFIYTHFTGGAGDHADAHLASRTSTDGGRSWSENDEIVIREEDVGRNIMSVSLLRLGDGRIALFYLRKQSNTDCRPVVRFSANEAASWSDAHPIIPDSHVGYYVMNNDRVLQLPGGRLVAPLAQHSGPEAASWDPNAKLVCYLSDDAGRTWRRGTPAPVSEEAPKDIMLQEPGVVRTNDDRLLMYCRTNAGAQYGGFSDDGGVSWSPMQPLPLPSPRSPATLERIPGTHAILAAWNDHRKIAEELRGKRTPYTLATSSDPAGQWTRVMPLADSPHGWYCYTAMHFTDEAVLLGHSAGDRRENNGLAYTKITRVPLKSIPPAK